jgi:hypothetical protein
VANYDQFPDGYVKMAYDVIKVLEIVNEHVSAFPWDAILFDKLHGVILGIKFFTCSVFNQIIPPATLTRFSSFASALIRALSFLSSA